VTHLTTNQIELLRLAAGADDGATDAPGDAKTVRALIKRGLLIALPQAEGPSRLIITEAGRAAVTPAETPPDALFESEREPTSATEIEKAGEHEIANETPPAATPKGKLGILVTLLRGSQGVTVAEMSAATGWLATPLSARRHVRWPEEEARLLDRLRAGGRRPGLPHRRRWRSLRDRQNAGDPGARAPGSRRPSAPALSRGAVRARRSSPANAH